MHTTSFYYYVNVNRATVTTSNDAAAAADGCIASSRIDNSDKCRPRGTQVLYRNSGESVTTSGLDDGLRWRGRRARTFSWSLNSQQMRWYHVVVPAFLIFEPNARSPRYMNVFRSFFTSSCEDWLYTSDGVVRRWLRTNKFISMDFHSIPTSYAHSVWEEVEI